MNKVTLLGRVGKDPEVKSLDWGKVANFSLATDESYKDKNGDKVEKSEWHYINCKMQLADVVERYVMKGNRVLVDGKIQSREYEKDGVKHKVTEILAQNITIIDWPEKSEKPNNPTRPEPQPTDDFPF